MPLKTETEMEYTVYYIPGVKVGCTHRYEERVIENRIKHGNTKNYILGKFTDINIASDTEIFYNKKLGFKNTGSYVKFMNTIENFPSKGRTGKLASSETKLKQSNTALKNNESYQTCDVCGFIGRGNAMKRWHFDNCGREDRHAVDAKHPFKDKPLLKCTKCEFTSRNLGVINRWHNDNCTRFKVIKPIKQRIKKPIQQRTREGVLIKEFDSMKEILKNPEFKRDSTIYSSIMGRTPTAYGYKWNFGEYNGD